VLTPPDASAQAVFETGNEVGELACQLFPYGKEVPFTRDYDEMIAMTKAYIDEGVQNIYEATFSYNGILVMVDILQVDDNNGQIMGTMGTDNGDRLLYIKIIHNGDRA